MVERSASRVRISLRVGRCLALISKNHFWKTFEPTKIATQSLPMAQTTQAWGLGFQRLGLGGYGLGLYPLLPPVAESAEGPVEVSPVSWVEGSGFGGWDLGFRETSLSAPRERRVWHQPGEKGG